MKHSQRLYVNPAKRQMLEERFLKRIELLRKIESDKNWSLIFGMALIAVLFASWMFSPLANASIKDRCQNWLKAHWISDDNHEYVDATDARLVSWYYQVDKLNDGFYNEVSRRLQYGLVDPETAAQFRVILENMK